LIQSFIGDHLGDPGLSPGMIAAAHHISVRTLHKLYQVQDQTISASIHWRRLERCRQDLLDPALRDRPVSAVGARWGFPDPATFSRAFRAAYGLPPGEYRAAQQSTSITAPGQTTGSPPTPETSAATIPSLALWVSALRPTELVSA